MVTARTGIEVVVRRSRVRRGPASGEGVEPPQRIRQGQRLEPTWWLAILVLPGSVPEGKEALQLVHPLPGGGHREKARHSAHLCQPFHVDRGPQLVEAGLKLLNFRECLPASDPRTFFR